MLYRYFIYLIRWQLSTPILAVCVGVFGNYGNVWSTVIANLIGGLIFFWVDRFIFTSRYIEPMWAVKENITCVDCGETARGYRLVATRNYDRRQDPTPEFRCEKCSARKLASLREEGVVLE
ncbi:MAG: hypothetical protein ABFD54_04695 [Armatimonadota bacterium]|nr:OPT/YSL family transporter [bacterium]